MAADYSTGYGAQYKSGGSFYPISQQPLGLQNSSMNAGYAPNFPQQGYFNGPPSMNQGYGNMPSYPPNYGMNFVQNQPPSFAQQPQVTHQNVPQSIQAPTLLSQKKNNEKLPLEIRGGVVISNCHCTKKNGLQDHCRRSECMVENENKRWRQSVWRDTPTKDIDFVPNAEANNIIPNPSYQEYNDKLVVPSNAEPVPVSYNYV